MRLPTVDAQVNGPLLAKMLQKQLRITSPIPFEVEQEDSPTDSASSPAPAGTRLLYTINYQIPRPRPIQLAVNVLGGKQVLVGTLMYSTAVRFNAPMPLKVEEQSLRFISEFSDDDETIERLNADRRLTRAVRRFLRWEYALGKAWVQAEPFLNLVPLGPVSRLTIGTLPQLCWHSLSCRFDAPAFLAIAERIESLEDQ